MKASGYIKLCSCCKKERPIIEFSFNKFNNDGLHIYCKVCDSKKQLKHRGIKKQSKIKFADEIYEHATQKLHNKLDSRQYLYIRDDFLDFEDYFSDWLGV